MRRGVRIGLGVVVAVPAVLAAALAWLLATEAGLKLTLAIAQRQAPAALSWSAAHGRLIGPLTLEGLRYADGAGEYRVGRLALDWAPGRLLARRLSIHVLHIEDVELQLPPQPDTPAPSAPIEPGWSLPLELVVRDLAIRNLRIRSGADDPIEITEITAAASSGLEWIDIQRLALRRADASASVQGRLGLGRAVATDLALQFELAPAGYAPLAASGHLRGTWDALELRQALSAPVEAEATVALNRPFADLTWALELTLPVASLNRIAADWPALHLGGALHASGDLRGGDLRADLETDWEAATLYPLHLEATLAEDDDGSLALRPLLLQQGEAQLRLTGNWDPVAETFRATLAGRKLRWPLTEVADYRSESLTLELEGRLEDYRLALSGELAGAGLPAAVVQATGQGSDRGLALDRLQLDTLKGVIEGGGRVDWSPQLAWDVRLAARDVDPGTHWPEWPGRLNTTVRSEGRQAPDGLAWSAVVETLDGLLRGYPVSGGGEVRGDAGGIRLNQVALRSGQAELTAAGTLADQWNLDWRLQAPDLGELLPDLAGRLEAEGALTGSADDPRLRAAARAENLRAAGLQLGRLELDALVGTQSAAPLQVRLQGAGLEAGGRRLATIDLDLTGTLDRHRAGLRADGPGHALTLAAAGGWDGQAWAGRIERADWRLPEAGAWQLAAPAAVRLGPAAGSGDPLCWRQEPARLCTEFGYDGGVRTLAARLSDFPLAEPLRPLLPPGVELGEARLNAELTARQPPQAAASGRAQLTVSPATLAWGERDRRMTARLGGMDATVELDGAGARGNTELRLTGADRLSANVALPGYQPGQDPAAQAVTGAVRGEVRDFAVIEGLLEDVDQLSGALRIAATLTGTLADPALDGELRLDDGRAFVGAAGVQLEDVQLVLKADPARDALGLEGSVRSGPGQLRLSGAFRHFGSAALEGDLHARGDAFEAVNLPEARVLISPDIRLALQPRAAAIKGTLTIPEATLTPRDFSGAQTPSKDVVLVQEETAPEPGWAIDSRVAVRLGDKVSFDGFGLSGRFEGSLDVVDEPRRVSRGTGELRVVDGVYEAYGQKLKIETGRLLFRDSPLDNPALDVRAVRRTDDVLAGVRVQGYLQEPRMELYSQPPLPEADQLSYLLLGRPVEGASGAEGEMLYKAATSLGFKGGNYLAQTIGSTLGLDEVSVGGGNGNDIEGAALTVGKYLSPKLYVNYTMGLIDDANLLQIRYRMSRRFTLQTETGTETGADILYTLER